MEPDDPGAQRFAEFKKKMEALTRAYRENTDQQKKLIRILQAAGFHDPADLGRKVGGGVVPFRPQPGQDAFATMVQHMAEDFLESLRPRRRR